MYGLVGKKLSHSFSSEIHQMFGNQHYQLYETPSIKSFIEKTKLHGFNVTIPYKTEIIPLLDDIDVIAKKTMSVNTVIKKENKLIGYNTDYYGLKKTLSYYRYKLNGKKILILGNGSVSKTVMALAKDLKAKTIIRLCRNKKDVNDYLFKDYHKFLDSEIIINTTPVGMYPYNDVSFPISLKAFKNVEVLIDLIYNPLRTKLMIEAEKNNIKTINGLYMLVMQAKKAHELFFNKSIPLNIANKIYRKIRLNQLNYVFIGMPLSGKSKYAKIFGDISSKIPKDMDQLIEEKNHTSIPKIFSSKGEAYFREEERLIVESLYKNHSQIISTGGGIIKNEKNMDLLKQNGIIIFLDKDPNRIAKKKINGRPLLKTAEDVMNLANERLPIYKKNADIQITMDSDTETITNLIKEKIDEYISR